jgi:hypothetical protein
MELCGYGARGGGKDTAAHRSCQGIKRKDRSNIQLLLHRPVLRMQRVIHAVKLDDIFLPLRQRRRKRLPRAQARQRLLCAPSRYCARQPRGRLAGSHGRGMQTAVCLDAADGLGIALGRVQREVVSAAGLRCDGCAAVAGARRRRRCGADLFEARRMLG